jgi:hypothetical protein
MVGKERLRWADSENNLETNLGRSLRDCDGFAIRWEVGVGRGGVGVIINSRHCDFVMEPC